MNWLKQSTTKEVPQIKKEPLPEETSKFLNKPIKELGYTGQDEIYFKLPFTKQIKDLKLRLQLEGGDYEEDIQKVCNYNFYKWEDPRNRNISSYLQGNETVSEFILNLRFKKDFVESHSKEGILIWFSWEK